MLPDRSAPNPAPAWRAWRAYVLVFGASLCTLVLEIVAGRVLAPTVGVSLFTWTSVIGVVLAGVAVGSYAGGALARRAASPGTLAAVLLAAGASAALIAFVVRTTDLNGILRALDLLPRVLTLVTLFFFVPSALLGMVTPLVAQLTLRDAVQAGAVVGRLGAVSAAGSIAGTFLTGFLLVPAFGTRTILVAVAAGLLLLALLAGAPRPRGRRALVSVVAVAAVVGAGGGCAAARDENRCLSETAYYCIRLHRSSVGPVEYEAVRLDRIINGYTSPEAPRLLVAVYTQGLADLLLYQADRAAGAGASAGGGGGPLRVLFVGGGSYTLPRYVESVFPDSRSDVLEIDPGVTEVARRRLGVVTGDAIRVFHGDARLTIDRLPDAAYHVVVGDAFTDLAVPWHLTTREFAREVRRVLRPDGLYATNLIDTWPGGRFVEAFYRTLAEVFPHVALVQVRQWDESELNNWLVVGSFQPLDPARLEGLARPGAAGPEPARARVVDPARVQQWLAGRRSPVLTDDFAPVDSLLAPRILNP